MVGVHVRTLVRTEFVLRSKQEKSFLCGVCAPADPATSPVHRRRPETGIASSGRIHCARPWLPPSLLRCDPADQLFGHSLNLLFLREDKFFFRGSR